jgi:hypothetical protein
MITRLTENKLTFWELPLFGFIFSLVFSLLSFFALYSLIVKALGGFEGMALSEIIALFGAVIGVSVISVHILYRISATRIDFDRLENKITVTNFGLFGKKQEVYAFNEIEHFCLIDDGESLYSLGIKLISGQTVQITPISRPRPKYEHKYELLANRFMHKQMPASKMNVELTDEQDSKMR